MKEFRRAVNEQTSLTNSFRRNEQFLLKQVHVLEMYMLEKMGHKGPSLQSRNLDIDSKELVNEKLAEDKKNEQNKKTGLSGNDILKENNTSIVNNNFNVIFNNTKSEIENN